MGLSWSLFTSPPRLACTARRLGALQPVDDHLSWTDVRVVGFRSVGRERGSEDLAVGDGWWAELGEQDRARVAPQLHESATAWAAGCGRVGHEVAGDLLPLPVGLGVGHPDDAVPVTVGRYRAGSSRHPGIPGSGGSVLSAIGRMARETGSGWMR